MFTLYRIAFRADRQKSHPVYYENLSDIRLSTLAHFRTRSFNEKSRRNHSAYVPTEALSGMVFEPVWYGVIRASPRFGHPYPQSPSDTGISIPKPLVIRASPSFGHPHS